MICTVVMNCCSGLFGILFIWCNASKLVDETTVVMNCYFNGLGSTLSCNEVLLELVVRNWYVLMWILVGGVYLNGRVTWRQLLNWCGSLASVFELN